MALKLSEKRFEIEVVYRALMRRSNAIANEPGYLLQDMYEEIVFDEQPGPKIASDWHKKTDSTSRPLWFARKNKPHNRASSALIRTFWGHLEDTTFAVFSPDGKQCASGSSDKTIRIWELSTGREIRMLLGHERPITALTFSPDGKFLVSTDNSAIIL